MSLQEYGEKFIDVDGIRTRYFEAGSGPPVVLVHGGAAGDASGAANAEDWALNFTALAKRFTVFSVDRLAQGYTDNPKSDADWTMAASCHHFARFLQVLGRGPYHLVGHSRGGYVVCRATLEHPRLVTSCIIVDSNSAAPGQGRNELVFSLNPHKSGTRAAARYYYEGYSFKSDHITDEWLDLKQKIVDSPKGQAAIAKMKDEGLQHSLFMPELVGDREELFRRLELEGLVRPTLLIWGYNDPTAPFDLGLRLYDLIAKRQARTQLHVVNEAGHHSFRERADEFNRVVTEFIDGVCHGY